MELLIFNNITNNEAIKKLLSGNRSSAMQHIIPFAETEAVTSSPAIEYVMSLLANDDNILSKLAQENKKLGNSLLNIAKSDLEIIFDTLLPLCNVDYAPSGNDAGFYSEYVDSIKNLITAKNANELLTLLIKHYTELGSGILAKYIAFKYEGTLLPIENRDGITFSSLVGLDYQKEILVNNTTSFIAGKRANNVLLFGDRGTGKSSSVKALLNMFCDEGLRVIEMPKSYIKDIPCLTRKLSVKPHKYIIFLDDLSFESTESDYKSLKVSMDGQLQETPKNVLIYATSNRRHLIKETWADREGGEVHTNDNLQETLSLAERFGISLVFSAPTQKEYLYIVSELLKKRGIQMNADIERKAIVWQMNYSGRSGRCAAQFVSSYIAGTKEN